MDILPFFKGLIDSKPSPIVICNIDYRIIFMNKYAIKAYEPYGGKGLIGQLVTNHCGIEAKSKIDMVIEWFKENPEHDFVYAFHDDEKNEDVYMAAIRDDEEKLIGFTSVHECRTPETGETYSFD